MSAIPADGLPAIGGTFNTVIGVIFLAIVIISPDGLMGIWDRLWDSVKGRGGTGEPAVATTPTGPPS